MRDEEVMALGERGFFVRDGFVDAAEVRAARQEALALEVRPAGVSRGATISADIRGDQIAWADAGFCLWPRFEALRDALNREAWLGLGRFDVQVARYPGGGARYARHRDAFRDGFGGVRRLTAIVYLNDPWRAEDGGLLRLHVEPGPVDVEPVAGRLVVFLAETVEHEVLPAFAERLAVTAWYYRR